MQSKSSRNEAALPADVQQEILRAIAGIQFGSVEVVIHDSRVVQIEAREKIRLQGDATRRP
jgi:hypothetical protein